MSNRQGRPSANAPDPLAALRAAASSAPRLERQLRRVTDTDGHHLKTWATARAAAGTVAETYLRRLGLTCPTISPALRFTINRGVGINFPWQMVAAIRTLEGTLAAVRCTRLSSQGERDPMQGSGLVGRPSTGAVQLAKCGAVLGIADEVEDALAATQITGIPCWAAAAPPQARYIEIPASVRELHIFTNAGPYGGIDKANPLIARFLNSGLLIMVDHVPAPHERWIDAVAR